MSAMEQLKQIVRERSVGSRKQQSRLQEITDSVFATSPFLKEPDFRQIHPDDIRLLFELYDEHCFNGLVRQCLGTSPISFRLSRRMTRVGGKTTRFSDRRALKPPRYEIAVSTTLLFSSFQDPERKVTVTGLECGSRLEGLMRIMEHELVHLIEMLVWQDSSCSQPRFQQIAAGHFGHTDYRHDLITPREVAVSQYGIRPGVRVRFDYEGHRFEGVVNRITRRATVLVAHPDGEPYTDGQRYMKFYIPLPLLEPLDP